MDMNRRLILLNMKICISRIHIFSYNKLGDFMALKGVVIDPGHGGTDPGAVANNLKKKIIHYLLVNTCMIDLKN